MGICSGRKIAEGVDKDVHGFFENEQTNDKLQFKMLEINIEKIDTKIERLSADRDSQLREIKMMFQMIVGNDDKELKTKISNFMKLEKFISLMKKHKAEADETIKQLEEAKTKFHEEVNNSSEKRQELIKTAKKEIDKPGQKYAETKSSATKYYEEYKKAETFIKNSSSVQQKLKDDAYLSTINPSQVEEKYLKMKQDDQDQFLKELEDLQNVPLIPQPDAVPKAAITNPTTTSNLGKLLMAL